MTPLCGDACDEPKKLLETKRDIPRINGSSGAFIAIVVCLVFIIIAAWVAIIFLLRDQRAFDIEQARRPKRDQPLTTPHLVFSNTRSTWSSRITTFIARASQKINIHVQNRRGNTGWAEADNRETDTGVSVPGPPGVREVASTSPSSLQNVYISHSTSTISGSLSSDHLAIDPHGTRGSPYPQKMILPHSILPSIESQLSSESLSTSPQSSNSHLPTSSSESIPNNVRFDADSREYVGSSGMIMRTLQGGTKFVEGF